MNNETNARQGLRESEISVRSLIIPLEGMTLLVPNALVSEVATLGTINTAKNSASWLHGTMEWRGVNVPLVSFERVTGKRGGDPVTNSRAIIFNTLNSNPQLPFIALLSQRIPRLVLVTGRVLKGITGANEPGILCRVDFQGEKMVIPDLDKLEQLMVRHGMKVEGMTGYNQ